MKTIPCSILRSDCIQNNRRALLDASEFIANNVPALAPMHAIHQQFDNDWYETRALAARNWVTERIVQIIERYSAFEAQNGQSPANMRRLFRELGRLQDMLTDIRAPPEP